MRKRVLLFVLISVLMSVCIPICSQNTESADFNQGVKFNESHDSVFINTDYFKITDVSDSAMMEKIRRLPGVEIDAEGHIYVNGKMVQRILWGCNCSDDNEDPELSELTEKMISKISKIDMLEQASPDILFVVDGKPVDSGWIVSNQAFGGPTAGFPSADKDQSAYVFVQDQGAPQGNKASM